MKFRKIAYQLHLWIGLVSGIIVFIVCLTGAIWAVGINGWVGSTNESLKVPAENSRLLLPSQLFELSKDSLQGYPPKSISYGKGEATYIRSYGKDHSLEISVNPYQGEILKVKNNRENGEYKYTLWDYMRWGHRALWLPWEVGQVIVNYGTLAFVVVLITGLIIWFPKSKKAAKNRLWFNWKKSTPTKRKIFDLHSVLGFYICFILLAVAITGMVWGIEWWSKGLYKISSGGKDLPEWTVAKSDSLNIDNSMTVNSAVDRIFEKLVNENPEAEYINISVPDSTDNLSAVDATVYINKDTYYNSDRYSFDRYSLKEIKIDGPYNGKYAEADFGDKFRRMNYEIHIGAIFGTPGRILVFLSALFGASLPVSGLYIYIKMRSKKKKKK